MNKEKSTIDIEEGLARLGKTDSSKIKACLFNLLIYTHTGHRTQYAEDIVKTVVEKFPCRIIHIEGDLTPESDFLSIREETVPGKQATTRCESIFIQAGGSQLKRLPSLILPHIVPDLPTYLLWGEDVAQDHLLLGPLLRLSQRLIFDSEATEDLHDFAKKILEKIASFPLDFVDLNWARIACWRHVIAKIFHSPECLEDLFGSQTIQITYNDIATDGFHNKLTQALYLQCWLAARLGWTWKESHATKTTYLSRNEAVEVDVLSDKQEGVAPGGILRLSILSDGNEYRIERKKDLSQVAVHISKQDRCLLPFTLALPSLLKGKSFMKEVFFTKTSDHYRFMLQELYQLPNV